MANLYRIIQPVTNIEEATAFYSQVLGLPGERISPGRHYFDCEGTILACYDPVADGDEPGEGWRHHDNQYIYLAVSDLERTLELVKKAGGMIEQKIAVMPWGERLFYIRDPFGNPVCFVDEKTIFRSFALHDERPDSVDMSP